MHRHTAHRTAHHTVSAAHTRARTTMCDARRCGAQSIVALVLLALAMLVSASALRAQAPVRRASIVASATVLPACQLSLAGAPDVARANGSVEITVRMTVAAGAPYRVVVRGTSTTSMLSVVDAQGAPRTASVAGVTVATGTATAERELVVRYRLDTRGGEPHTALGNLPMPVCETGTGALGAGTAL
ncbi:MAG TPA: hypothetical protein VFK13_07190 [Gemmatimonadaceae bacterium]|nr:hypothetical protein [Gemmatimonadaceae bacterium]